jgi:hypothetical protein
MDEQGPQGHQHIQLRDSLALSEGDWIPLRHEGRTYHLVVEPALLLLDTDVEVDLLPSEAVERAERAAAEAAWRGLGR